MEVNQNDVLTYDLAGDRIPTTLTNDGLVSNSNNGGNTGTVDGNVMTLDNGLNYKPNVHTVDSAGDRVVTGDLNQNGDSQNVDNDQQNQDSNITTPNFDDNTSNNDGDNNTGDGSEYDNYSNAALFSKLLEENELPLFESIDPNLTPQQFVEGFKNRTHEYINSYITKELETLGNIKSYVEAAYSGVGLDQLNPLLAYQKYIDLDVNDHNVTESQLEESVKSMYMLQGVQEEAAKNLVELDKDKGLLVEKSLKSQEVHKQYVDSTTKMLKDQVENEKRQSTLREQQEAQSFATGLLNTKEVYGVPIDDKTRAVIYDNVYKRDQLVKIQSSNGSEEVLMSKYELMMYNIVNNPESFIKLNYILLNNLNVSPQQTSSAKKSSVLDAIDKNKNKVSNNINLNNKNFQQKPSVADKDVRSYSLE